MRNFNGLYAGTAEGYQITASGNGSLSSLSVYVDAATTATNLFVGLYSDNNGHPSSRLTAGNSATFQTAAWNTGLAAGTYTGHVRLNGGGITKTVTVVLTMTSPAPVLHTASLSWQVPTGKVISYGMSARPSRVARTACWRAPSVGLRILIRAEQSGTPYYYVVTAVDSQGRESKHSNEFKVTIP